MRISGKAIAVLVIPAILLTGCATKAGDRRRVEETRVGVNEQMTIDMGKADTQAIELRIASAVPTAYVERIEQGTEGTLMLCSHNRDVQWAGGTKVYLRGSATIPELLELIESDLSKATEYQLLMRDESGEMVLDIMGPHGSMWIVGGMRNDSYLDIASWSQCMPLPDGLMPSDRY